MRQLDGLRAVAVLLVMAWHWLPSWVWGPVKGGPTGVRVFFVLSGFLITGILLRARSEVESGELTIRGCLGRFYARRALRILPLYYATLATLVALDAPAARGTIGWHAMHATNLYAARIGDFPTTFGHFWSLAVEEQFYLAWPLLVLLMPRRAMPGVLIAMLVCGPASRAALFLATGNVVTASVLTPSCLDTLGAGAALAWAGTRGPDSPAPRRVMNWGLALGLPAFGASLFAGRGAASVLLDTGVAGCAVWVVGRASRGFGGPVGWFLGCGPMVYLGVISYGLYVLHGYAHHGLPLVHALGGPPTLRHSGRVAAQFAFTVGAASASWFLFERPLLSLKPGRRGPTADCRPALPTAAPAR